MSFFEDDEDAAAEPDPGATREHRAARPRPRRTGPPRGGGSRRPPGGTAQAVRQRQLTAGVVIVVVIILVILLVHSCQASDTTDSLKDYNNSVSSLIDRSDSTGSSMFSALKSPGDGLTQTILQLHANASAQLSDAENLAAPGQMAQAQQDFVTAMSLRASGLSTVANDISDALNGSGAGAGSAVQAITGAMSQFYASDVLYKTKVVPEIAAALHGDGIPVGGANGVTVNGGQFVHDLGWLSASYVATTLGAKGTGATGTGNGTINSGDNDSGSGPFGHALTGVSVAGTTLSQTGTNNITAKPAPTFVLNFTNGGVATEYNVGCEVTVIGGNDSGRTIVPQTTAGESTSCSVTLKSAPPTGGYQIKAEIVPVPGETNTANNTITYTVDFQ